MSSALSEAAGISEYTCLRSTDTRAARSRSARSEPHNGRRCTSRVHLRQELRLAVRSLRRSRDGARRLGRPAGCRSCARAPRCTDGRAVVCILWELRRLVPLLESLGVSFALEGLRGRLEVVRYCSDRRRVRVDVLVRAGRLGSQPPSAPAPGCGGAALVDNIHGGVRLLRHERRPSEDLVDLGHRDPAPPCALAPRSWKRSLALLDLVAQVEQRGQLVVHVLVDPDLDFERVREREQRLAQKDERDVQPARDAIAKAQPSSGMETPAADLTAPPLRARASPRRADRARQIRS